MQKQKAPEVGVPIRREFSQELRSVDEAKRQLTVTASTEKIDRYGDSIKVSGWRLENYKRNPVVLFGHRASEPAVGKTVAIWTESSPPALVHTIEFASKEANPLADTLWRLYKDGFMSAVSVGFLPLEQPTPISDLESNTVGYEYTSQELLELSLVSLPANSDCVARARAAGFSEADLQRAFSGEEFSASNPESVYKELISINQEIASIALDVSTKAARECIARLKAAGVRPGEAIHEDGDVCTIEELVAAVKQAGDSMRGSEECSEL